MKAEKDIIIKAAELGILRSMEEFLQEPLKAGRLKTRFLFIQMIVDEELNKIYRHNPNFFIDNKTDITIYLQTLSDSIHWIKGETHIASVISFCLAFLERSKSTYVPTLCEYLNNILDYYERVGNVTYRDIYNGQEFDDHWQKIKELTNNG